MKSTNKDNLTRLLSSKEDTRDSVPPFKYWGRVPPLSHDDLGRQNFVLDNPQTYHTWFNTKLTNCVHTSEIIVINYLGHGSMILLRTPSSPYAHNIIGTLIKALMLGLI